MSWLKRLLRLTPALLVSAGLSLSLLLLCWKADGAADPFADSNPEDTPADSPQVAAQINPPAGNPQAVREITNAVASVPPPVAPVADLAPTKAVVAPDPAGVLESTRLFALGMIETGNNDSAIGGLGEVSRFQIMPSVWKQYSTSREYQNLSVSTVVASQHLSSLHAYFKEKTGREPTDFDLYVLWNTRFGYYASREFSPERLHPVVRDRAQRFANLVEDGCRRGSVLVVATRR